MCVYEYKSEIRCWRKRNIVLPPVDSILEQQNSSERERERLERRKNISFSRKKCCVLSIERRNKKKKLLYCLMVANKQAYKVK